MRCGTVQCGTVQCSTVQFSTGQCGTVQCSSVQCGTVQYSTVQCTALDLHAAGWMGQGVRGCICPPKGQLGGRRISLGRYESRSKTKKGRLVGDDMN